MCVPLPVSLRSNKMKMECYLPQLMAAYQMQGALRTVVFPMLLPSTTDFWHTNDYHQGRQDRAIMSPEVGGVLNFARHLILSYQLLLSLTFVAFPQRTGYKGRKQFTWKGKVPCNKLASHPHPMRDTTARKDAQTRELL